MKKFAIVKSTIQPAAYILQSWDGATKNRLATAVGWLLSSDGSGSDLELPALIIGMYSYLHGSYKIVKSGEELKRIASRLVEQLQQTSYFYLSI